METTDISTLKFDDHNFNKGTEEGAELMQRSFEKFGAGRSILIDKDNHIIAGNKSTQAAIDSGIKKVRIVETDAHTIIAVKRKDISLDSPEGRELALADNATTAINLSWDEDELKASGIDTEQFGLVVMPDVDDDSVDAFFSHLEDEAKKNEAYKIVVTMPGRYLDQRKEIVKIIRETLAEYNHIKIAT